MKEEELLRKFLGLEDEADEIVEAWKLFIETNKAFRDVDARVISRREGDNIRRKFAKHVKKNRLKMLDDEEGGLKTYELAIGREGEEAEVEGELKRLNSFDLWLLADFPALCTVWVADGFKEAEGFPDAIRAFLDNPHVNVRLKERLIEKDKARGEELLKTLLDAQPSAVSAHLLLVWLYEREGRLEDAEAEYTRMSTETDDEVVWTNYGDFLEKNGRYEEAFDAFKQGFEVCERIGRADDRLGTVIKDSISRVERMKNLEGEAAAKAREYWDAVWLIEDIREFADKTYATELEKAPGEYKEEKGIDVSYVEDTFDFFYWFLFSRALGDGRTLGMVYAEEKGLSDELKERLQGLGNPVSGDFEVVSVDRATFTFVAKNVETEEEYELQGSIPDIEGRLTFAGNIYPWGDFYLTECLLKVQEEEG
jgi:tetratricopeptide (TPR) repeat protein